MDSNTEIPLVLLNSVLATLNARAGIKQAHLGGGDPVSVHLSNLTTDSGGVLVTQEGELDGRENSQVL